MLASLRPASPPASPPPCTPQAFTWLRGDRDRRRVAALLCAHGILASTHPSPSWLTPQHPPGEAVGAGCARFPYYLQLVTLAITLPRPISLTPHPAHYKSTAAPTWQGSRGRLCVTPQSGAGPQCQEPRRWRQGSAEQTFPHRCTCRANAAHTLATKVRDVALDSKLSSKRTSGSMHVKPSNHRKH